MDTLNAAIALFNTLVNGAIVVALIANLLIGFICGVLTARAAREMDGFFQPARPGNPISQAKAKGRR